MCVKSGHAISITVHSICAANFSVHSVFKILCIRICVYLHRSIEQVEQVMETEGMYLRAVQLSKHADSWVMESISQTHTHTHTHLCMRTQICKLLLGNGVYQTRFSPGSHAQSEN